MAPPDPSQHIGRVTTDGRARPGPATSETLAKTPPLEPLTTDIGGYDTPGDPDFAAVPLWRRATAYVLDTLVVITVQMALTIMGALWFIRSSSEVVDGRDVVTAKYPTPSPWGIDFAPLMTFIAIALLYETVFLWKRGQTPAKELMKIRVTRVADGGLPTFGQAARRSLVLSVFRLTPGALMFMGSLVAFFNGVTAPFNMRRRSLADYAGGTMVVYYDAKKVEGPVRSPRRPNQLVPDGLFGSRRFIAGITGRSEDFNDREPRQEEPGR